MRTIGAEVIVKESKLTGVIMGWDEKNPGSILVKVWDDQFNIYKDVSVLPRDFEIIKNRLFFTMINQDDVLSSAAYIDFAIDQALDTGDQEWFNKLVELKKNRAKSKKELLEERAAIKLGSVVSDRDGYKLGIVTAYCINQPDTVFVTVWSPEMKVYLQYRRKINLLLIVENQKLIEWVNGQDANKLDKVYEKRLNEAIRIAAVDCNDKEWYKSTEFKEEVDGA